MKLRVLSIGRRIAIAVCAVLALVTGTLGVLYPRLAGMSAKAEGYSGIAVETDLTAIETGLDQIEISHLAQLKTHLTVKADGVADPLPADAYTVDSVAYNGDNAVITVSAPNTDGTGRVEAQTQTPITSVAPVVSNVHASVNENAATLVNGIWKVTSNQTESVFLTDTAKRPVSEILSDYLNVTIEYQTVTLPVSLVQYNEEDGSLITPKLGQVYSYRINQKSFTAGPQNITVSVQYGEQNDDRLTDTISVTFEDVQIISLRANVKDGVTLYSYSDVVSNINVWANYNDGRVDVPLSERDYTSPTSLFPTAADIQNLKNNGYNVVSITDEDGKRGSANDERDRDKTSYPDTASSRSYTKDIVVEAGGLPYKIEGVSVNLANPYQFISINGVLGQQIAGQELKLEGISIATSFVTDYQDKKSHVGFVGGLGSEIISTTKILSTQSTQLNLEDFKESVEVSYDGGEFNPLTSDLAKVPANAKTVNIRFTYNGQMFVYADHIEGSSNTFYTYWKHYDNSISNTFNISVKEEGGTEDNTANYWAHPSINEDIETYRPGLSKSLFGVDFSNPNNIASGMTVEIENTTVGSTAQGTKLKFTYTVSESEGVKTVVMTPDTDNAPGLVGVSYTQNGRESRLTFTLPGTYKMTFTLPTETNNKKNYWEGVKDENGESTNVFTIDGLEVNKGALALTYTNLTFTAQGYVVPQGNLINALQQVGVMFSAGGNIVSGNDGPQNYTVYARLKGETAGHPVSVVENGAKKALTQAQVNALKDAFSEYDVMNTEFELYTEYTGTPLYMQGNTSKNPVPLKVIVPDVSAITDLNRDYKRETAQAVIDEWEKNLGYLYTVTITKEDGSALDEQTLHAGTYSITFVHNASNATKTVPLKINKAPYGDLQITIEDAQEYDPTLTFNDLRSTLQKTAEDLYAEQSVYYTLGELIGFQKPNSSQSVTDITELTGGTWNAVFATGINTAEGDKGGDYDTPYVYVTFTISALSVNLAYNSVPGAPFSGSGIVYAGAYAAKNLAFELTGWNAAAQKNIGVSIEATLLDGTTTIPSNFYTVNAVGDLFCLTVETAGVYKITFTNNNTDNVTFTDVTYTVTVNKASSDSVQFSDTLKNGISVKKQPSFQLPQEVVNGVSGIDQAKESLRVGAYVIYAQDKTTVVAGDALETGKTYYIKVTGLTGNYVRSADNYYQATFTYAVNYTVSGNWWIEMNVVPNDLPELEVKDNVDLTPVSGGDYDYELTADFGQNVDILSYFSNAGDSKCFVITVENKVATFAARANSDLSEQLLNGTLGAGEYTVTVSPNSDYGWVPGAKNVTVDLTVKKQAVVAPEIVVINGSYADANKTQSAGSIAAYWQSIKDIVTATVYRFDTTATDFTLANGTVVADAFNVANGTLTYTDAGIYYVVFSLEGANHYWSDDSETEATNFAKEGNYDRTEVKLAQIARQEISAPPLNEKRVWNESQTPAFDANGSYENDEDYKVEYAITHDSAARTVTFTLTKVTLNSVEIDLHNLTWVRNLSDTFGLQYLDEYGKVLSPSQICLNYAVVKTQVDIAYNTKATVYYGGYNTTDSTLVSDVSTLFTASGTDAGELTNATVVYNYVGTDGTSHTFDATALQSLTAGNYVVTIAVTFNNSDYTPVTFTVALTVSPRPVVLIVNGTLAYGGALTVADGAWDYAQNSLHFNSGDVPEFALTIGNTANNAGSTVSGNDWLELKNEAALSNYAVSFDETSALTVGKGTAYVNVTVSVPYGSAASVDSDATYAIVDADGNVLSLQNVTGTLAFTLEDGKPVYTVESLTHNNYNFVDGGKGAVKNTKLAVTVTIDNKTSVYGKAHETLTYTVDESLTDETLLNELAGLIDLSTDATVVGTYVIEGAPVDSENFDVTFVNGTYTITFDLNDLTVDPVAGNVYNGSSKILVTANEPAALEGVRYAVYYYWQKEALETLPGAGNTYQWSSLARETAAGTYYVYYYIEIDGFEPLYCTAPVEAEIKFAQNALSTDFNFANGAADKDQTTAEGKVAFTFGNFDANGDQRLIIPAAQFGGTLTYALYAAGNNVAIAENATDLEDLFAAQAKKLIVGTYRLTVKTSDAENYASDTAEFFFKVDKAVLTIAASNKNTTYGEAAPSYEYRVSGLNTAVGDTENSVLNGVTITLSCAYAQGSNATEYPITFENASALEAAVLDNYTIALQNGALTVAPRRLTVRINSVTVGYRATKAEVEEAFPETTLQLLSGTLYAADGEITDILRLAVRDQVLNDNNYINGELNFQTGTRPIYAVWKDAEFEQNYAITFSGCDYNGNEVPDTAVGEGEAFTAGTFTVSKLFVNVVWSSASRSFVYDGTAIALTASSTSYSHGNGGQGTFVTPKELVLSYATYDSKTQEEGETKDGLPTDAGTYKIYAAMGGTDGNNYMTGGAYIIIVIEKASLNVALGNATMVYGNNITEATASDAKMYSFDGAIDADKAAIEARLNALSFKRIVGEETVSDFAVLGSVAANKLSVGVYSLQLSNVLLDDEVFKNYNVVTTYGTLYVTQRSVTVTVNNFSAPYTGKAYTSSWLSDIKDQDIFTVDDMPENGDVADVDTLKISFSIASNAVNVGNYDIAARALNSGNYRVTFANNHNNATFAITPAVLTVNAVVQVVYGETSFDVIYEFEGFVNNETYRIAIRTNDNVPEYELAFVDGEYSVTHKAGTAFSFMNYKIAAEAYTEEVSVIERQLSASIVGNHVFNGGNIEPKVTLGNVYNNENVAYTCEYTAKEGSALTDGYAVNAGNYTVTITITDDHYTFRNGKTVSFDFEIEKRVLDIHWAQDNFLYDSKAETENRFNELVGFDDGVNEMLKNNVLSITSFLRVYYIYSTDGNTDNDPTTDELSIQSQNKKYGRIVDGVGTYTLKLKLQGDAVNNYVWMEDDGNAEKTFEFLVYANSVDMNVSVADKEYDGEAAKESISIEGTAIPDDGMGGWMRYLVKSYATNISEEKANELFAKLESGAAIAVEDVANLSFVSTAPVDAGYHIFHVVYFRNTSEGRTEGADAYVLYRILPKVIYAAPSAPGVSTEIKDEEGNLVETLTTSVVYNGVTQTFTVLVSDENAFEAFREHPDWISVTGIDAKNNVILSGVPEFKFLKGENGKANRITFGVELVGTYTITFALGNNNYIWDQTLVTPDPDETGEVGEPRPAIPLIDGNVVNNFSITTYIVGNDLLSEGSELHVAFGGDYFNEIKNDLYSKGLAEFVNLDNASIRYYVWREDDNYLQDGIISSFSSVGRYYYAVFVEASDNYSEGWLNGTFTVDKKEVSVIVNATMAFGGDIVFDENSFIFDGFVGGDEAQDVLTIDYARVGYVLGGKIGDEFFTSEGLLIAGTYENYLTQLETDTNGNILGFALAGQEDNYVYVFDASRSTVTVNPLNITVTVGNANSPYGSPINVNNVTLTTGNSIPETYTSLASLLRVSFVYSFKSDSNAGTYALSAESENPNYNVTFISGVYTITPIAVSIKLNAGGGVYGGEIESAKITSAYSDESPELNRRDVEKFLLYHYTGTTYGNEAYDSYDVPTQAGSYTVTAEVDPQKTGNFTLIGSVSAVFTVDRLTIDVTKLGVENLVYRHGATLTAEVTDNNGFATTLYNVISRNTFVEAGDYILLLSIREELRGNVQWSTTARENSFEYELAFTIGKADNNLTNIEISDWTFGEQESEPHATLVYDDGADIAFEYFVNGAWTTTVPVNAGNYSIRASVAESKNYKAFTSLSETFVIHKKTLALPSLQIIHEGEGKNDTFTGNTLLAAVLGYDAATMSLAYSDNSIVNGNTVTLTALNAGTYKITISLIDALNYGWADRDEDDDGVVTLYWEILPYQVTENPTENTDKFIVDGSILTYIPTGFDPTIMEIENNEIGHSGKFIVTVRLKDKANYTWANGGTEDITFEWTVEGISNLFVGVVGGVAGVLVIAAVAFFVQMGVHNKKKKREAAEMENRDNADNAEEEVQA